MQPQWTFRGTDEDMSWLALESHPGHKVGGDTAFIEAELTSALGRRYWGQGYATEMGGKLVEFRFTSLGIHRIINGVRANNDRSIGLMRRLGFRVEPNNASTPPGSTASWTPISRDFTPRPALTSRGAPAVTKRCTPHM